MRDQSARGAAEEGTMLNAGAKVEVGITFFCDRGDLSFAIYQSIASPIPSATTRVGM